MLAMRTEPVEVWGIVDTGIMDTSHAAIMPTHIYWTEQQARKACIDMITDVGLKALGRLKMKAESDVAFNHNKRSSVLAAIFYYLSWKEPDFENIKQILGKAPEHIRDKVTQIMSIPTQNVATVREVIAFAWATDNGMPMDVMKLTIQPHRP